MERLVSLSATSQHYTNAVSTIHTEGSGIGRHCADTLRMNYLFQSFDKDELWPSASAQVRVRIYYSLFQFVVGFPLTHSWRE